MAALERAILKIVANLNSPSSNRLGRKSELRGMDLHGDGLSSYRHDNRPLSFRDGETKFLTTEIKSKVNSIIYWLINYI